MAEKSVEETIQEFKKIIEAQDRKIENIVAELKNEKRHSQDIQEIQNLMGRYENWHTAGMHDNVLELFARNIPDVSIEIPHFGIWYGYEGIRKCWEIHKLYEGDRVGFLVSNVEGTPVIEVAGDGKTGKGVWTAIGIVTDYSDVLKKRQAIWSWKRYAMDFIKEDGKWKIWHFRVFPLFSTPFEKSWVEESLSPSPSKPNPETMKLPDELKPDKPFSPYYEYSTTAVVPYSPEVPMPYETWDDSMSY